MTKEEVIKDLIDMAKNGANNPLDAYCDSCSCLTCPFHSDENGECPDELVGELIGRLIKAEESQKVETNLEHYAIQSHTIRDLDISQLMFYDVDTLAIELKEGWQESFNGSDPIQWLLSPYEELKPKYKLTQFEYDLLSVQSTRLYSLNRLSFLGRLIAKGYFKDIPTDISFNDILANCEVVEE